jgi:adsorption protein B
LLRTWQAVDESELSAALKEQAATQMPLGHIMVSNGWLDEETLAEAIAYQSDLPRVALTTELVCEHANQLPPELGTRYRAIYIGKDDGLAPLLAVASPLSAEALGELETLLGAAPQQRIARESEIAIALRLVRGADDCFGGGKDSSAGVPLLGDTLIDLGLLKRDVFDAAMQAYRPDQHGRVGDYLVERGVIPREVIERVVRQQHKPRAEQLRMPSLGGLSAA